MTKDGKIKIMVVPSDRAGVGFFRSLEPHLFLKNKWDDEVEVDIYYDFAHLQNFQEVIKDYDILHFHKNLDPKGVMAKMASDMGVLVIGDIDDNWNLGDYHPMSFIAKTEKWYENILANLRNADVISTTTPLFAQQIKRCGMPNVMVIPNALSQYEAQFIPHTTKSKRLRFGFICGSSHLHDMKLFEDCVKKLPQETLDKIQIVLCGFDTRGNTITTDPATKKKIVTPIRPEQSVWCEYEKIVTNNYSIIKDEDYIKYLKTYQQLEDYPNVEDQPYRRIWNKPINEYATLYNYIDVLLAPIKPCDFNLVKSQLKVIEAGWFGKAFIGSNFGPYTLDTKQFYEKNGGINPLGNALLVDVGKDSKQWAKYIKRLADNPQDVMQLGFALHQEIVPKYNIEQITEYRLNMYKEWLEKKKNGLIKK